MCRAYSTSLGIFFGFFIAFFASIALPITAFSQIKPPVIFAAASLKTALDEVSQAWAQASGKPAPAISYAGSHALARQIEQGAPADLFFSADQDWMDYLSAKALIQGDTRVHLLTNRIALIASKGAAIPPLPRAANGDLLTGANLAHLLGKQRLAIANVEAVPAGKYGKAALIKFNLWDDVKNKLAQAENVRAALLLVSRGEAPLGIVYTTDAAADSSVEIIATFPEDSHPKILYPAALIAGTQHPDALALLHFLQSDSASEIFMKHGFMRVM